MQTVGGRYALEQTLGRAGRVPFVVFGDAAGVGAYMVCVRVVGLPLAWVPLPFSVRRALDVLAQLADVLEHVHRRGLVHGDLRAESIIMVPDTTKGGRRQLARLLDVGVANRYTPSSPAPAYHAPERIGGAAPPVGSDVYALGELAFQLLPGQLPFTGSVADVLLAQVYERPARISDARCEPVDEALVSLVGML